MILPPTADLAVGGFLCEKRGCKKSPFFSFSYPLVSLLSFFSDIIIHPSGVYVNAFKKKIYTNLECIFCVYCTLYKRVYM